MRYVPLTLMAGFMFWLHGIDAILFAVAVVGMFLFDYLGRKCPGGVLSAVAVAVMLWIYRKRADGGSD